MAPMYSLATIPCGFAPDSLADRDALISIPVNYSKDRLTQIPKNTTVQDNDGVVYNADGNGGSDISTGGNIWAVNRTDGHYVNRYGGKSAHGVSRIGPTGTSLGIYDITGGIWDTGSTGTHLPHVIGLSWRWDWHDYQGAGHSASASARVQRVSLLYTDRNRNMKSYGITVKANANSENLNAGINTPSTGGYFAYKVNNPNWGIITNPSNPLFFMGVIIQWYHNHGAGNQTLAGSFWNAVPIIGNSNTDTSLATDWYTNPNHMLMTVKDSQTVTSSLATGVDKAFALQPLGS